MDEIHAPAFGRPDRDRGGSAMQCRMLPSPHPHAQLQSIEAVESMDTFAIHRPAFAAQ